MYGPCNTGWATGPWRPRCATWRRPPMFNDELDLVTIPSVREGRPDATKVCRAPRREHLERDGPYGRPFGRYQT
jgi:hypothetical protein